MSFLFLCSRLLCDYILSYLFILNISKIFTIQYTGNILLNLVNITFYYINKIQ